MYKLYLCVNMDLDIDIAYSDFRLSGYLDIWTHLGICTPISTVFLVIYIFKYATFTYISVLIWTLTVAHHKNAIPRDHIKSEKKRTTIKLK